MHGHLQCASRVPEVWRSTLPNRNVVDLCYYLLAPVLLMLTSFLFAAAPAFLIVRAAQTPPEMWLTPDGLRFVGLLYLLTFTPVLVMSAAYARHAPDVSLPRALLVGHSMPVYNYIWYVAVWRAVLRILTGRRGWAKTARHADTDSPAPTTASRAGRAS